MTRIFIVSVSILATFWLLSGCAGRGVHGENSIPAVFLTDGEVDYTNPYDPVTGEDITDAEVTLTNEATGEELLLEWYDEPSGNMERGSYGNYQQDFPHGPGEEVSLQIVIGSDTISGGPTMTPDSTVTIDTPAHQSDVTLPFDVTWTATEGDHPASHVFVFFSADSGEQAYMDVVPMDDGTITIEDGAVSTTGAHHVTVWPTNIMELAGKVNEGSADYVKSSELSYSAAINVL